MSRASHRITEPLVGLGIALGRALTHLPRPLLWRLCQVLGLVLYGLVAPRRRVALRNLALCMPERSPAARAAIARRHFAEYLISVIDRFYIWRCPQAELEAFVRLEGQEHLQAVQGRPCIVLAPHFFGLDAGGLRLQALQRMVTMYAFQSSPRLNALMLEGRGRFNNPVLLSRQDGIGRLIRAIKQGLPAYFLPDLDFGPRDAVFAPFFGQPAATVVSVVRLSQLTGAVVLPMVTRLTPEGYEGRFYPHWTHVPDEDPVAGVTRMNAFIEARIRETPSQYLWTHRRFKTRPPGMDSVY